MEAGLAIITSDTVGAAALIDPGRNGYVFRNGNADDLAGYLKKLFRDPGLVAQMGLASRQRIIQFRPGKSARRLALLCRGIARHTPMPDFQDGLCSPMNPKTRALKDLCEKWLATR